MQFALSYLSKILEGIQRKCNFRWVYITRDGNRGGEHK